MPDGPLSQMIEVVMTVGKFQFATNQFIRTTKAPSSSIISTFTPCVIDPLDFNVFNDASPFNNHAQLCPTRPTSSISNASRANIVASVYTNALCICGLDNA